MRRMRICFTDVFLFFFCFFFAHNKNTRQPFSGTAERIFMKLLPNDSGENGVCIAVPKWGLGPRLIFFGAKNYTLRTWRWRLASDSELVCWLWHCAATAVALQRHERANAFNPVSVCIHLHEVLDKYILRGDWRNCGQWRELMQFSVIVCTLLRQRVIACMVHRGRHDHWPVL